MNVMTFGKNVSAGFTLIELVMVLTVLAILVGWGFPSLTQSIRSNRMVAQNNELVAMLAYARSEAIRRNEVVPIVFTHSGDHWEAFVVDPSHVASVEGCEVGLLRCSSNNRVVFDPFAGIEDGRIDFNSRGYIREADEIWQTATIFLQHVDCHGPGQRRRIDILPTGQLDSCRLPCDSMEDCS